MTATAQLKPTRRALATRTSMLREIFKVTQQPDIISLAGGLPAPETFPAETLRAAFNATLTEQPATALQYSTTEGMPALREWIAARESARGIPTSADEVLIVAGSQQALDLVGKAYAETGEPLLVESPSYLGALQAFSVFEPAFRSMPTDDGGLIPEAIDAGLAAGARIAYVMPNFQNPTGRTLSEARRIALAQAAREHDFWLVEDDPYGDLWYREAPPPSLRRWAPERTIRLGSFSKVLAPGLRVGFVIAPADCIRLLVRMKQATDLHTGTLVQHAAYRVVTSPDYAQHLADVRERYAQQAAVMLDALAQSMPAGVRWVPPVGGMFVWLRLPAQVDALELFNAAVERKAGKVAFVPGAPFYHDAGEPNTLRLSFVTVAPEKIRAGIAALGELIAARI